VLSPLVHPVQGWDWDWGLAEGWDWGPGMGLVLGCCCWWACCRDMCTLLAPWHNSWS